MDRRVLEVDVGHRRRLSVELSAEYVPAGLLYAHVAGDVADHIQALAQRQDSQIESRQPCDAVALHPPGQPLRLEEQPSQDGCPKSRTKGEPQRT